MKLIVGLGNPGEKYAHNRHNVGFLALDRIAHRHGIGPWRKRFQGQAADGEIGGERVLLLKPQTYMNDSGRSVGEAVRFLKLDIADVVVLYDEIDLAPGKLKAKVGGGNAGHNGLRSISAHLDNDYVRVRIGVGHPGHKDRVAGFVLNDFAKADKAWLDPLLDAIADAAGWLAKGNPERLLTEVARQLQTEDDVSDRGKGARAETKPSPRNDVVTETMVQRHPASERSNKRHSALADNLRKWMAGRNKKEGAGE